MIYEDRKPFIDLLLKSEPLVGLCTIPVFLILATEESMCDHKWIKTKYKLNLTGDEPYWVFRICKKCGTGSFVRDKEKEKKKLRT